MTLFLTIRPGQRDYKFHNWRYTHPKIVFYNSMESLRKTLQLLFRQKQQISPL
jgi:16S rRNA C1402 (ribose-2'-O) methylase RsmI